MLRPAYRTGMVLGKFLPPHLGHLHLIDFARASCERLFVVVGTLEREPIPGALRARWMAELCPQTTVLHLTDENPQLPEEHPLFWEIWRASLQRILPEPPDVVFASERYGLRLAAELGADFVPVDPTRTAVPISATRVRADPYGCWPYLPRPVRSYYTRHVMIVGPESSGKTTLAARLAARLGTAWVPEYARTWLEHRLQREGASSFTEADLGPIVRGQLASASALAPDSAGALIHDTDVLTTSVWAEATFGACPHWIYDAAATQRADLTLVCGADVPFVPDPVRYFPERRAEFEARIIRALERAGRVFVRLPADPEARMRAALDAVAELG